MSRQFRLTCAFLTAILAINGLIVWNLSSDQGGSKKLVLKSEKGMFYQEFLIL